MQQFTKRIAALAILTLAFVLAACNGDGTPPDQTALTTTGAAASHSGTHAGATTVNVTARNFAYDLDTQTAKAGKVTFAVRNTANDMPHDFAIRGNGVEMKTPMLKGGETAQFTVDLKPGTYTYWCTIPGHDFLGMKGTFTVTE
jgi:plastocyanin